MWTTPAASSKYLTSYKTEKYCTIKQHIPEKKALTHI